MKKNSLLPLLCVILSLTGCVHAPQDDRPDWITDQALASITQLGINPQTDIVDKTATYWRYRSKQKLHTGGYSCPVASSVDISRDSILIIAPKAAHCTGPGKSRQDFVRLSLDGSIEPLVVE